MEIIQKNKLALDLHDSAKSYYERSQEYGYKFLMSLKQIRDEKLFKDLGFSDFEEYTKTNFGYSKNTINERILSADEWGVDYDRARSRYGERKVRDLAQLPTEERVAIIKSGIETEHGNKNIDEATTRELAEYKRKLKESEERNKRLEEQALKQEVVEKEVVVEKVPEDYNYYKSNYEAGKGVQEFYKKQNEELREEMKELENIIKTQRANSASQSELQKLEEKKATLNSEIESLNRIAKFQEAVETFISDNASLSYTKDFEHLYSNIELTLSLQGTFNRLKKWIEDTESLLPDGDIIEGE